MNTKLTTLCGFLSLGTAFALPIYNPANGHYYDIVDASMSWDAARAQAEGTSYLGHSGHLATITSDSENDFIVANFPQVTVPKELGGYMLGGYQADTSGTSAEGWAWVTGEAFSYTNWSGGEPNDFEGGPENYLSIHDYLLGANPTAAWNDGGNFSNGYIIEFSPTTVPEAGSTMLLLSMTLAGLSFARRRK